MTTMQSKIEKKLKNEFAPTLLKVVNDSSRHKGHSGDDGSGESHFIVSITSGKFDKCSKIACQRMVFDALKDEMKLIHALSITTSA